MQESIPFFKHNGTAFNTQTIGSIQPSKDGKTTTIYFHGGGEIKLEKTLEEVLKAFGKVISMVEL